MTTSTHKSKTPPPAGTRPPAPPWVKIAAWLVLLLCLSLAAARGPLLRWAAQPVVPLMQPVTLPKNPTKPVKPGVTRAQNLARFKGMAAAIIRVALLPPGYIAVQGAGALGLGVIGLDLAAGRSRASTSTPGLASRGG